MAVETGANVGGPINHGGNLALARAEFREAPEPWIDLSTGINPHSYPYSPIPANAFSRLPEPETVDLLKRRAALAYGATSHTHLAVGPGTQMLLPIVARLIKPRSVAAILSPTYAEHSRVASLLGFDVRQVTDPAALADADLAVVVNPNNPTGRVIATPVLLDLAARMREKGGLLVVDEAFQEVSDGDSVVDSVSSGGLLVLRSFGKFFGMAGVRLGFAISHPCLVARIEDMLGPWCISGPALHIANEALLDRHWKMAMRDRLHEEARRLDMLLATRGIAVSGGTSLFRYIQHPEAPRIFDAFGRCGIFVRKFNERPRNLRIGLPGENEWERLQQALENLML